MPDRPKIPRDLLKALNYSSPEEAALEMVLLTARSRYSEYRQEVKRFEEKYGMSLDEFEQMVARRVDEEDFEQEEDLMAWKFAQQAADYWREKIEELERAA